MPTIAAEQSAFLTQADIFRMTGKRRYKAQCKVLGELGVRFRPAANGEPLVRASDLDDQAKPARNLEPRWDRLRA